MFFLLYEVHKIRKKARKPSKNTNKKRPLIILTKQLIDPNKNFISSPYIGFNLKSIKWKVNSANL